MLKKYKAFLGLLIGLKLRQSIREQKDWFNKERLWKNNFNLVEDNLSSKDQQDFKVYMINNLKNGKIFYAKRD